jgi:serine/threonine protein kinase
MLFSSDGQDSPSKPAMNFAVAMKTTTPPDRSTSSPWRTLISAFVPTASVQPNRCLITGSEHAAETAERRLLCTRLRSVTLILLLASMAFFLKNLTLNDASPRLRDAVQIGSLLLLFAGLMYFRSPSFYLLRTIEVLIFFGMALDFSWTLNDRLAMIVGELASHSASDHDYAEVVEFIAAIKDQVIAMFGLMLIYGMFIPNTVFRSTIMVLLMAIVPAFVIFGNHETREALNEFEKANANSVRQLRGNNLLTLVVGACVAIYGTMVVNRLRRRVQDAEELGQYRVHRKLGSGGMGDVFLAEHRLLKRLCAVKLIRSDFADDPIMLNRFEREVRATALLTHWNTIQVFDYGKTDDGRFFYVMEYLYGRNMLEIVRQFGPLPADRTIFILKQVCEALRESHSRGLVHRDIKPSNIFLSHLGDRFDVVKLLDFGLVRPVGSIGDPEISGQNQINGSPRYMCPEQAQGVNPDIRGDIYSLGAVAYFLLSGRPPFRSDNPLQLLIAHATQAPPTFAEIGVSVPEDLSLVVMKCLIKSPAHRYGSPEELLQALHSLKQETHWTWAIAEHWWKSFLPDAIGPTGEHRNAASVTVPGVNQTIPNDGEPHNWSTSGFSATDPTLINLHRGGPQPRETPQT